VNIRNLDELQRRPVDQVLTGLGSTDSNVGISAANRILEEARSFALSVKDYLIASITPVGEGDARLNGYEQALSHLNIPITKNLEQGVDLRAATDTFATKTGTRILFPDVLMDIVKWTTAQDNIVTTAPIVAQTRTIQGNSAIMMDLVQGDVDNISMFQIAEGGEIPLRKITTTERSVKMYKVGHGYEFTYEFGRRANIDILTPYVNRINRQFELDKVKYVTAILVNGDGVASAITVDNETSYGGTNGSLEWKALFGWLVERAAAGYPIDTLIGNFKTYGAFIGMFTPTVNTNNIPQAMEKVGGPVLAPALGFMNYKINFAISNTVADNNLVGIIKAETIEELVEAGSDIQESQRLITTQKVQFVRTLNVGYNLVTPQARRGFSFAS
jgi:hypothetical protein